MKVSAHWPAFLVFIFILSLVTLYFLSITPIFAQRETPIQESSSSNFSNTNHDVPNNLHTYTQSVFLEVMSAIGCQVAGIDTISPNQKCLGTDQKTGKIGFLDSKGGAIGFMQNMIAILYTPPIHLHDFTSDLANNFGIAKHAYAAPACDVALRGTGYCGIIPLLPIWSQFRNIVYMLFALAFVIVGLSIMLRIKIDPRTVMGVQNQLPKITVALILVFFSFAIVGFLIDIMYVSIYLLYNIIANIPGLDVSSLNPATMTGSNPITAIGGLEKGGIGGMAGSVANAVRYVIADLFGSGYGGLWGHTLKTILGFVTSPLLLGLNVLGVIHFDIGDALGLIGGAIAFLVIAVALLWALFRVWFALLGAYIFLLLDIVFAPFWISIGVFPGNGLGFTKWLRDVIANLAAFPITITMFLLGRIFIEVFTRADSKNIFVPPLIGNPANYKQIGALIGIGIIFLTPNALRMARNALKPPEIDTKPIAAAIGRGFAAPGRLVSGGTNAAFGLHPQGASGFTRIVRGFLGKG